MGKQKNIPSNANRNKHSHNKQFKKKHTSVVFNAEQRDNYLKNMFGAKKRRKQFYKSKIQQQQKQ